MPILYLVSDNAKQMEGLIDQVRAVAPRLRDDVHVIAVAPENWYSLAGGWLRTIGKRNTAVPINDLGRLEDHSVVLVNWIGAQRPKIDVGTVYLATPTPNRKQIKNSKWTQIDARKSVETVCSRERLWHGFEIELASSITSIPMRCLRSELVKNVQTFFQSAFDEYLEQRIEANVRPPIAILRDRSETILEAVFCESRNRDAEWGKIRRRPVEQWKKIDAGLAQILAEAKYYGNGTSTVAEEIEEMLQAFRRPKERDHKYAISTIDIEGRRRRFDDFSDLDERSMKWRDEVVSLLNSAAAPIATPLDDVHREYFKSEQVLGEDDFVLHVFSCNQNGHLVDLLGTQNRIEPIRANATLSGDLQGWRLLIALLKAGSGGIAGSRLIEACDLENQGHRSNERTSDKKRHRIKELISEARFALPCGGIANNKKQLDGPFFFRPELIEATAGGDTRYHAHRPYLVATLI